MKTMYGATRHLYPVCLVFGYCAHKVDNCTACMLCFQQPYPLPPASFAVGLLVLSPPQACFPVTKWTIVLHACSVFSNPSHCPQLHLPLACWCSALPKRAFDACSLWDLPRHSKLFLPSPHACPLIQVRALGPAGYATLTFMPFQLSFMILDTLQFCSLSRNNLYTSHPLPHACGRTLK